MYSADDVVSLIERGNLTRATSATKMNAASSRSHAVFSLMVQQDVEMANPRAAAEGGGEEGGCEWEGEGSVAGGGEDGSLGSGGGGGLWLGMAPHIERMRSKINLVDLAGSERAKLSGADEDAGLMKELVNINKSLSALGNVIGALTDGRCTHVPYRDSKLTQLLEESLGGNSSTVMINAVSCRGVHAIESLSTLQWAKRAQVSASPHP